jgi:uncharacterized protein YdeI (BOF family)
MFASEHDFATPRLLRRLSLLIMTLLIGVLVTACGNDGAGNDPNEGAGEPVTEATQPMAEPTMEPTEPMAEPTMEPTEPMAEPTMEPTEPMAEPTEPAEDTGTAGGDEMGNTIVGLDEIEDNPDQYAGQTVTVNGEVTENLDGNAFSIDQGNILNFGEDMLVVMSPDAQAPTTLEDDTQVQITGEVRYFAQSAFEEDYGIVFDDGDLFSPYEDQPAIVAGQILVRATVSEIDDEEDAYLGNRVSVIGDVTEIVDARTFRLDDPAMLGGDDILVTMAESGMQQVTVGDEVQVVGTVRSFDREQLTADTGYDYDVEIYNPFAERTIILANQIQVVGQANADFVGDTAFFADDNQTTISDVSDNPDAYLGQQVQLNGEVSQVFGPNTIRMDEDNWLDIGDDILVIIPPDVTAPQTMEDETNIIVEGEVRNFVLAEVVQDFDFFGDSPDIYAEFENRPAVVASTIFNQATLSDIDDNPESYIGNNVSVYGEAIEIIGATGFRLEDPMLFAGDDVLVLTRDQDVQINEGAELIVTGTVQRFNVTDAEDDLDYDLDDELFTDWDERIVILADSIQTREAATE